MGFSHIYSHTVPPPPTPHSSFPEILHYGLPSINLYCVFLQKKLQEIGPPPDEEPPEVPTDEIMVRLIMCVT